MYQGNKIVDVSKLPEAEREYTRMYCVWNHGSAIKIENIDISNGI